MPQNGEFPLAVDVEAYIKNKRPPSDLKAGHAECIYQLNASSFTVLKRRYETDVLKKDPDTTLESRLDEIKQPGSQTLCTCISAPKKEEHGEEDEGGWKETARGSTFEVFCRSREQASRCVPGALPSVKRGQGQTAANTKQEQDAWHELDERKNLRGWCPHVKLKDSTCIATAEARADWLVDSRKFTPLEAQEHVMLEFPAKFPDRQPRRQQSREEKEALNKHPEFQPFVFIDGKTAISHAVYYVRDGWTWEESVTWLVRHHPELFRYEDLCS
mmetsp:Transcript_60146/g.135346  ORF Transcript_60146/g.135346 Transcript_60146/m.135346 type:complete len:273 (-) Transcript_60146:90-908(-)